MNLQRWLGLQLHKKPAFRKYLTESHFKNWTAGSSINFDGRLIGVTGD
jgi:hypothetical protein